MYDMLSMLRELLADACGKTTSRVIALSGGLDSTVLAHLLKDRVRQGVAVIADDFVSTDLTYCQAAAAEFGMDLAIRRVGTSDLLDAAEETIRILGNFNDIEIRNNIVMYLGMTWARDNGFDGIITGDGADELFAGYQFFLDKPRDQLDSEIDRVCRAMHFPSHQIGASLGVRVESPFLDPRMVELARDISAEYKVREEGGTTYGKWAVRKAFEGAIPAKFAWRAKSPMQDGSGTAGLTGLFDSVVDDKAFAERKSRILEEDGIIIRTKESLHYYEAYKKAHGPYRASGSGTPCGYCGFDVGGSRFCRMCGAFPA